MISKYSKLNSLTDAKQWASEMLDGGEMLPNNAESSLAHWLWNNFHGQTYGDAKHNIPDNDEFWELVDQISEE